jgi:hypothetical protein
MKKFRCSFQTACNHAGIPYPVRMDDIRHLFASTMLTGGDDLAAVSRLLGHSNIQMTAKVYYNLQRGEKERAVNLLPSLHDHDKEPEKVIPFRAAYKMSSADYVVNLQVLDFTGRGERI